MVMPILLKENSGVTILCKFEKNTVRSKGVKLQSWVVSHVHHPALLRLWLAQSAGFLS